ncbi:hypothetical protein [Streptosporangium sp. NPDC049644]|uniref:hypothetical protein n=1 Tax=Streptosporangium sp. NPDC049644 TaxID=3155507 RepID=UPI00341C7792
MPANTRRAYERQWAAFSTWCIEHGRVELPATGHTLAEYVETLCAAEWAPASIEQAIACVRTMHRLAGHPNQPATDATRLAPRACKRTRAEAGTRGRREAPPVGIDALRAMVSACDLSTRIGLRDRLLLVLGLALMGRRSELVALTCDDVREVPDGLEVTIRTSKTDKDSQGETIAIPRGSHPLTDPVAVWTDWIAVLAEAGETSGRLLRRHHLDFIGQTSQNKLVTCAGPHVTHCRRLEGGPRRRTRELKRAPCAQTSRCVQKPLPTSDRTAEARWPTTTHPTGPRRSVVPVAAYGHPNALAGSGARPDTQGR